MPEVCRRSVAEDLLAVEAMRLLVRDAFEALRTNLAHPCLGHGAITS
jgi:hypothetical protein